MPTLRAALSTRSSGRRRVIDRKDMTYDVDMIDSRLAVFHGIFLTLGTALLLWSMGGSVGYALLAAGVLYNVALPIFAARCTEPRWIRMWGFLFPLSWLQIFPDWYLVEQLGTLTFPDLGVAKIGPVSAFMGLLWIVPLFLVVHVGENLAERHGLKAAALGSGALAVLIFGISEATLTLIPVWHPVGISTAIGPMALYVLGPEAVLGASAWWAFRTTESRSVAGKLAAAILVMLGYILTLTISYRLFEGPLP